ncbi:UNVERIFIED_CONTAM: hypothetical protein NCL1_13484 [Trichonephila clavipes]
MSDDEQRCATKFRFRLGHNATETFEKLQHGDSVLSRAQFFCGLRHFQKEESQLKMNLAAEGPQFRNPLQMSLESGILCVQDRRLTVRMIGEELNLNHTPPFIRL